MSTKTKPTSDTSQEGNQDLPEVLQQLVPYWRAIAGVAIVAITGIVLYSVISNNRREAEEASWATYFEAVGNSDANGLQQLADKGEGTVVPWAYQAAAQAKLNEGTTNLFRDRGLAKSSFEEAVDGFTKAIDRSDQIDLLNQRSIFGLAQAHEGLNDLEKAKAAYKQLMDRWPESALAKRGKEQIAKLEEPEVKDFHDWFFSEKPPTQGLMGGASTPSLPFTTPTDPVNIPNFGSGGSESATPITDALGGHSDDSSDAPINSVDLESPILEEPVPESLGTDGGSDAVPATDGTDAPATEDSSESPETSGESEEGLSAESPAVDSPAETQVEPAVENTEGTPAVDAPAEGAPEVPAGTPE